MFKSAIVYRVAPGWEPPPLAALEEALVDAGARGDQRRRWRRRFKHALAFAVARGWIVGHQDCHAVSGAPMS